MILVFILLGIIIFILTLLCMIVFSTLKIQIQDLSVSNIPIKNKANYNISISLYFLNHIKWIWFSLNNKKIKRLFTKMPLLQIDLKKMEQDFKLKDLKILGKLQLKISDFHLQAELGLESPITTAFTISIISSMISIILPHFVKSFESKKYQYTIMPIYQNKNLYKIKLNCIIELKMVHIINVIYILIKKGKSDENERTTSNRKSYGYSYE